MQQKRLREIHNVIEHELGQGLSFFKVDPFDFASVSKRKYLTDLYQRSRVVKHAFDSKLHERYERYKVPGIKFIKKSLDDVKKKFIIAKDEPESDPADLNNDKVVYTEIDKHEELRRGQTKDLGNIRQTHSMNKLKYDRLYRPLEK